MNRLSFSVWAGLAVLMAARAACGIEPGEGYQVAGQLRPRHASEITASNWSVGAETMDRDFTIYRHWRTYLGPLGAKKARLQSGWAKTEKVKGQYDWAWLDEIVSDMVAQGVEPWICICYGNPVYPDGGETGLGGGWPTGDEALAAWDRYVAALVERYQDRVDEWEIWNEPGLRRKGAAPGYADLLIRTAAIVRGVQPKAQILGLSLPGMPLDFVREVLDRLKEKNKLDLVDELTYHPYSYNPCSSYATVEKLRALVDSYAAGITIRQGENGAPSVAGGFGAISQHDWNEESQAKWALRRLLGDLGRDIPSSYFSICDMKYPDRVNYKGLLAINPADQTVDHAKTSYRAVQHLTAVFDDRLERIKDFSCELGGEADKSKYSVFAYRRALKPPVKVVTIPPAYAAYRLVTIWRSTDIPGDKPEVEHLKLTLNGLRFQNPVWVDLLSGKVYRIAKDLWKQEEKAAVFSRVPVYDSPVLVAEHGLLPLAD